MTKKNNKLSVEQWVEQLLMNVYPAFDKAPMPKEVEFTPFNFGPKKTA